MITINVAICDDDTVALSSIAGAVTGIFNENDAAAEIEQFSSAAALGKRIGQMHFDLIFLDIEMPGTDGIEFGMKFRSQNGSDTDIIFVSSREDRVFDALPVHPFGFVRKSKFIKDISDVVKSFIASRKNSIGTSSVDLPSRNGRVNVLINQIIYFEGSNLYQLMHVKGQDAPVEITSRMEKLEKEFAVHGFMRIHKGYLVNYAYISRVCTYEIILSGGEALPISRRKSHEIKAQYLALSRKFGAMMF